jgi:hypothetical protein
MSEAKEIFVYDGIILTVEQQEHILEEWNSTPNKQPPSLKRMVVETFPNIQQELQDGRSKYGKCVKSFLSSLDLKARPAHEYKAKGLLELTTAQEKYISDNVGSKKTLDITKNIFKNAELTPLSQEFRTVSEFVKTLPNQVLTVEEPEQQFEIYESPKTFDKMLQKVNGYIHQRVSKNKMSPKQRKDIDAILGFVNTVRFLHQINTYSDESDRVLFESSFVRYTYDKYDLTQEEVDQYIVLATEVVISSTIQATIQIIQMQIDHEVQAGGRIPMPLIEANNTARTEYNQCVNRQQKLLNDLKQKRSQRLSKEVKANASILNLVEMWKEEESRKKMIHLAELRKKTLSKEIENLSSMDDIKARIFGLDENEVLNG